MNYIRIGIQLQSRAQAISLTRRLSELSDRLKIHIIESGLPLPASDDADRVGSGNAGSENADADILITDDVLNEHFPVSSLLNHIIEVYEKNSGKKFMAGVSKGIRVCVVCSEFGGSGSTSIGLTLARCLAGSVEGAVAFISAGSGKDVLRYMEADSTEIVNSRELEYALGHDFGSSIEKYMQKDRYGVLALNVSKNFDELIPRLEKESGVSIAVIDLGNSNTEVDCHAVVRVIAVGDMRGDVMSDVHKTEDWKEEEDSRRDEFLVINKSPYRFREGNVFKIPADEESFKVRSSAIEISMDRAFGAAVGELTNEILSFLTENAEDVYGGKA